MRTQSPPPSSSFREAAAVLHPHDEETIGAATSGAIESTSAPEYARLTPHATPVRRNVGQSSDELKHKTSTTPLVAAPGSSDEARPPAVRHAVKESRKQGLAKQQAADDDASLMEAEMTSSSAIEVASAVARGSTDAPSDHAASHVVSSISAAVSGSSGRTAKTTPTAEIAAPAKTTSKRMLRKEVPERDEKPSYSTFHHFSYFTVAELVSSKQCGLFGVLVLAAFASFLICWCSRRLCGLGASEEQQDRRNVSGKAVRNKFSRSLEKHAPSSYGTLQQSGRNNRDESSPSERCDGGRANKESAFHVSGSDDEEKPSRLSSAQEHINSGKRMGFGGLVNGEQHVAREDSVNVSGFSMDYNSNRQRYIVEGAESGSGDGLRDCNTDTSRKKTTFLARTSGAIATTNSTSTRLATMARGIIGGESIALEKDDMLTRREKGVFVTSSTQVESGSSHQTEGTAKEAHETTTSATSRNCVIAGHHVTWPDSAVLSPPDAYHGSDRQDSLV
ncbi:unnamed protein product [Amoebophrya sp. A120]|nr:unnamed protein product [Amoebophrya sp. A120]|eukprot:GSA120T00012117001.1